MDNYHGNIWAVSGIFGRGVFLEASLRYPVIVEERFSKTYIEVYIALSEQR